MTASRLRFLKEVIVAIVVGAARPSLEGGQEWKGELGVVWRGPSTFTLIASGGEQPRVFRKIATASLVRLYTEIYFPRTPRTSGYNNGFF